MDLSRVRLEMENVRNKLDEALRAFDGKALTKLTEVKARHGEAPEFLPALVELAGHADTHIASGATWLLKDHLENGGEIAKSLTSRYARSMPKIEGWQAQLHACQSLQFLNIEASDIGPIVIWLEALREHDRPFLRAWSLDGLVRVSLQHKAQSETAHAALALAMEDSAASVKARARKLSKLLARS